MNKKITLKVALVVVATACNTTVFGMFNRICQMTVRFVLHLLHGSLGPRESPVKRHLDSSAIFAQHNITLKHTITLVSQCSTLTLNL